MLIANLDEKEHAAAERTARWQGAAGEPAELIDPGSAERIQPGIATRAVSYLWCPREGQVDAQALADALGPALSAAGIRSIRGRVRELSSGGGKVQGVVLEDGRRLDAGHVVVAAGAWSGTLTGSPRPIPVRPVRGQMLRFPVGAARLRVMVGGHRGRYVVPRSDGTLLAGSTMEEAGFDRSLDDRGLETVHAAAQLVPVLGKQRPTERWTGLRPLSEDLLPILGPDPDVHGVSYAAGYGRSGITLAPLAGEIVANLIFGYEPEQEWRPFAAARFGPYGSRTSG